MQQFLAYHLMTKLGQTAVLEIWARKDLHQNQFHKNMVWYVGKVNILLCMLNVIQELATTEYCENMELIPHQGS